MIIYTLLFIYKYVRRNFATKNHLMSNSAKVLLKIVGLIALLIFLYFISTLVFIGVYGTGGQASTELNNGGLGTILKNILPLAIVGFIAYRTFRNQKL